MLEVGHVARAHGVQGEVVVTLVTDRLERVEPGAELFVGARRLEIERSRPFGDRFLVYFVGVHSRAAADVLHGATLRAEAIEDPDALWVHDMVGADVVEVSGTSRGKVIAVQSNPASDLLVLESEALVQIGRAHV